MRKVIYFFIILMTSLTLGTKSQAASVKRLSNGLRYVIVEDHASPVVSMQIWVRCGGVDENDKNAGVSHFLEHMIFKGTNKLTAGQISQVVESRGGSINAATGSESTHYYIDMPSDGFEEGFDVLAESVLHPSFPPEEFEKERQVILEEIKRRNDNPKSDLWDAFMEALYPNTPYKQQVIGSVKTITGMTRDMMVQQHAAYYVPENMVVVIIGDVKTSKVKKKIRQSFGKIPNKKAPPLPMLYEPAASEPEIKWIKRPAKQAHTAVGFVGPLLNDPRQVAMDVLSVVLGGGQSSRLFQELRENKQSVWNVGASFITHMGSGAFGIFSECPPDKARSFPNDVYFLLFEASGNGFTLEELNRAKMQIKSSWLYSQETYHGQASQWGFYTVLGRPQLMKTYLKDLNRVTLRDLKELLTIYFRSRPMSGVIVMPE